MNDEYLWDKSGEPDPEIQELEEVLGNLKYQPHPLEIPRNLVVVRRRQYVPYLAIAASLLFALLAAGFWLLRMKEQKPQPAIATTAETPKPSPATIINREGVQEVGEKESVVALDGPTRHKSRRRKSLSAKSPTLTASQRQEALAAKQQLLLALRLASEKLNLAQKKTLNPSAPAQIRNQHKVG